MRRNVVKISLDIVLIVWLVLLYESRVFSLHAHEVGGLAICGVFLIHNALNLRWITGVGGKLFGRALPVKTKVSYVVDALLAVTVAFIAISGVLISRTILTGIYGNAAFWLPAHFFSSAVALALVGVHIGLHWSFIRGMFARWFRLPQHVARPTGFVLLAVVLIVGAYSIATSGFFGWLTYPVTHDVASLGTLGQHRHGLVGGGVAGVAGPFEVILTYGSIAGLVAIVTALVEGALRRRPGRQRPALRAA